MTFKYDGVSFATEFPTSEALQFQWPSLSGMSIESLEVPRMERRRFLETTRPATTLNFDVILHGDSEEEAEDAKNRFTAWVDPTLGPRPLILDDDPDWYWEMTVSREIAWEKLTWSCEAGGFRWRATVTFESYNDAAARRVDEELGPGVVNLSTNPDFSQGTETVEVRRNLATKPRPTSAGSTGSFWRANYGIGGAGTLEAKADNVAEGLPAEYVRATWTAAASDAYRGLETPQSASVPVGPVALSIYVRPSVTQLMRIYTAGASIADFVSPAVTAPAGVWTRLTATATVTSAGGIEIRAYATAGGHAWAVGETLDATAPLVEASNVVGPYFDGDISPDPDLTPSWTGTPNSSASILSGRAPTGYIYTASQGTLWGLNSGGARFRIADTSACGLQMNIPVSAVPTGETFTLFSRVKPTWTGVIRSRIRGVAGAGAGEIQHPVVAGEWTEIRSVQAAGDGPNIGLLGRSGDGWGTGDSFDVEYLALVTGDYQGPPIDSGQHMIPSGNTRSWPTIQFSGTLTAEQEAEVTIGDFKVRVAGPLTPQDVAILNYDLMRFEVFRAGVKIASLVPRMSTLARAEVRPQGGPVAFSVVPVSGGTITSARATPNSRKQ